MASRLTAERLPSRNHSQLGVSQLASSFAGVSQLSRILIISVP